MKHFLRTIPIFALIALPLKVNAIEYETDTIQIYISEGTFRDGTEYCRGSIWVRESFTAADETKVIDYYGQTYEVTADYGFANIIDGNENEISSRIYEVGPNDIVFGVPIRFQFLKPQTYQAPLVANFYEATTRTNTPTDELLHSIDLTDDVIGEGPICASFLGINPNAAPVAHAGEDVSGALPNQLVYLDGSLSSDADGDELIYNWRQISGPVVDLFDADSATPSFLYPPGRADQIIEFELIVYDGTESSEPDNVQVIHNGRSNGNGNPGGKN